ncbi:MAG TPA: nitrous oxide reductase family maturation protein NosD, partial [Gemmatimonadales bacterium]
MFVAALVALQIVVRPGTQVPTLAAALERAHPGDTITITAGTYPTNSATVAIPRLLIRGEGWPVLDGEGTHEILVITAEGVRVEGIAFRGAGVNMTRDQAAVKVVETGGCRISGNRFDGNFFSIYLQRAHDCVVHGNTIHGTGNDEARNGNGIHLWNATGVVVDSNSVDGHRDGIYLEFARAVRATGNRSGHNRRYGLHFMFSNDCGYTDNVFDGNGAGVAAMYSREVTLAGNRFTHASGPSAYGLLLKEIRDSHIDRNEFANNTVALYTEGASRNTFARNRFRDNGWGVRLLASSETNLFSGNRFDGNSFDVTTN